MGNSCISDSKKFSTVKSIKSDLRNDQALDLIRKRKYSTDVKVKSPKKKVINYELSTDLLLTIRDEAQYEEGFNYSYLLNNNEELEDYDLLLSGLNSIFQIKNLAEYIKIELIKAMKLCSFSKNQIIIPQEAEGIYCYFIKSGEVLLYHKYIFSSILKRGDFFGEEALILSENRSFSSISKEDSLVWVLSRDKYKETVEHHSNLKFQETLSFLQQVNFLNSLDKEQKECICENIYSFKLNANYLIFKEGSDGDSLYIIKKGEVDCLKKGKLVRTMTSGMCFGEISILIKGKRTLDVVTKTECEVFQLTNTLLEHVMGREFKDKILLDFMKEAFSHTLFFKIIPSEIISLIYKNFNLKMYNNNSIVSIKPRTIHIVLKGGLLSYEKEEKLPIKVISVKAESIKNEEVVIRENKYYNFAETCDIITDFEINSRNLIITELIAMPDCLLLSCDIEDIENNLDCVFKQFIDLCQIINTISKVEFLSILPIQITLSLAEEVRLLNYTKNEMILSEGVKSDRLYIVKTGRVNILNSSSELVRTLIEGDSFGEHLVFSPNLSDYYLKVPNNCSLVEMYYIKSKDLFKHLNPMLLERLKNKVINDYFSIKLELKHLYYISTLSQEKFGKCCLVKSILNNKLYIIKQYSKQLVNKCLSNSSVDEEKKILSKLSHIFVAKYYTNFEDTDNIYYVFDYHNGVYFNIFLKEIGLLSIEESKFYMINLFIIADYLHKKRIIYRNFVPESIVVTEDVSIIYYYTNLITN